MKRYLIGFGILLLMLSPISLALILGPWSLPLVAVIIAVIRNLWLRLFFGRKRTRKARR